MSNVTKAGAAAKGRGAKGSGGPDDADGANTASRLEIQIGRMLVRAIWAQEWIGANPEGTPEQRNAAWLEARDRTVEKNLKPYRRALRTLLRAGVEMKVSDVDPQ